MRLVDRNRKVRVFRTVAVRRVFPLPLGRETLPPVNCLWGAYWVKGEEDWVLPSVTDLRRLQWVATQSFDRAFSPCQLTLDQYLRMFSLGTKK